jgi:hypothetical protein
MKVFCSRVCLKKRLKQKNWPVMEHMCPNNAKLKLTSVALGAKHLMKNMYNE